MAGSTVYTASVELDGGSYTDTKTVTIPATGTAGGGPGGAVLPKTGDDGGTAPSLAGALAAAGACSGVLAWRMIRKAG